MLYPLLQRLLNEIRYPLLWPGSTGSLPVPSAGLSNVTLDKASIDNDGIDFLTATITLLTAASAPIVGYTPTVLISPATGMELFGATSTNGSGVATVNIRGTNVGTKTVIASFNGVTITAQPTFDVNSVPVPGTDDRDVSSLGYLGRFGVAAR